MRIAFFEPEHDFAKDTDFEYFKSYTKASNEIINRCRKVCKLYGIKIGSKEYTTYVRQMHDEMLAECDVIDDIQCTMYNDGYVVAFRTEARKAFC